MTRPTDRARPPREFWKVEGGGNDFVLLDARGADRAQRTPPSASSIRRWLDRHRGIGADGLLQIDRVRGEIQVRYWNSDGGRAAFCGNGARCVALFLLRETGDEASDPGRQEIDTVSFRFGAAPLVARRVGANRIYSGVAAGSSRADRVALRLPAPRERRPRLPASRVPNPPSAIAAQARWLHAGVPHWIAHVPDVDRIDVAKWGARIRSAAPFGRAGTNVDFVSWEGRTLVVRTFERGVEGETLACGSGLLSAAAWAISVGGGRLPVTLRSRGGDRFVARAGEPGSLWLEGPVRIVFRGEVG